MDREAREELVRLLPRLRRFAFSLTGKMADADDLVQSACERALARISQWEPGSRLDSWMFRIIKNAFIDSIRKDKVRGDPVDHQDSLRVADAGAHRLVETRSTLARVTAVLGQLPEEQRMVVILVCVEQHSYREAAEILDIPVGTIMSRLARGRVQLDQLLNYSAAAVPGSVEHG
jgi:RNA polymerase sigma-70 factor, ECF subfamily